MLDPYPVQRCADQCPRVGVVYAGRSGEVHSASPALRGFWMNPRKDHPSVSDVTFNDRRGPVGVLSDNITPARELRAILPVVGKRRRSGDGNFHCCLANTLTLNGIEGEPHARSEIEPIVG